MLEVVDRQRGEGVVIWWGRDGSVMLGSCGQAERCGSSNLVGEGWVCNAGKLWTGREVWE